MLDRIADLCAQLSNARLTEDEVEHAAIALQALTTILVTRDVRAEELARWEKMSGGKLRLTSNPPTPEEEAAGRERIAVMSAARQAPAADIFDGTRFIQSSGRTFANRDERKAYLRETGREEVSAYDLANDIGIRRNDGPVYTEAQMAEMVKRAMAWGKETGQIKDGKVVPGAPVIPMPVQERPDPVPPKPKPEPIPDAEIAAVPLEARPAVNTESLRNSLAQNAMTAAIAAANARGNGTAAKLGLIGG